MFEWLPVWAVLAFAGLLGQLGRILLGVKKAIDAGEEIVAGRLVITAIISLILGALTGLLANDWKLAFLTGFSGTDVIESVGSILTNSSEKK